MAEHIYELGFTKTTTAAAGMIIAIVPGTLGSGIRMPEVREIGIYSQSGVAAIVGLGFASTAGATPTEVVVQALLNGIDAAGHTNIVTSYTTAPGVPSNFTRRADVQAVQGAGSIWTWLPGEFPLWSGASVPQLLVWQISTAAVTFDGYVKVAE